MDLPSEIAREVWWQENLYGCRTCYYVKHTENGKWCCNNTDNENNYGLFSEDIYECDDWEERRR